MTDKLDRMARAMERVAAGKSAWGLPTARRPPPTGEAIDRMLPTLDWLRFTDKRGRKLIWARAFGETWWKIAGRFGRSDETARRWYMAALSAIAAGLRGGRKKVVVNAGRFG